MSFVGQLMINSEKTITVLQQNNIDPIPIPRERFIGKMVIKLSEVS